ncbi:hypothetical protein SCLCIDRAFT_24929 [Scleroderma citrinum Foug A]|uniref:Uncharacterized protein n=1 Tax=Scleroderma citrinum Foug A TaxID=1036808 RepID=A0A0C3DPT8_9AGAM|nr:hypothetical protein SCLCIDRAFT_24929 [Scleroderma citrinum Foug A]
MYARFVGFGVGHNIQYHQSITNLENQDSEEEDILDESPQVPGNYKNDTNANCCGGGTGCDINMGTDGNSREDTFEDDEEEAAKDSDIKDMPDQFSDMENESDNEGEGPQFKF